MLRKFSTSEIEELFLENEPAIYEIVCRYDVDQETRKDLIAISKIAFMKALNSFDDKRGIPVNIWIKVCVRNAVLNQLRMNRNNQNMFEMSCESLDTLKNDQIMRRRRNDSNG